MESANTANTNSAGISLAHVGASAFLIIKKNIYSSGAAILTAFVSKTEYQLLLKCKETVPWKVENKMRVMVVDGYGWASRYQIFAAGAPWLRTSHIFFL